MNILEMTTFLRGGAGVLTTQLSCFLKQQGHQVTVVSSGIVDEIEDWDELVNVLSESNIKHYVVNTFKREGDYFWVSAQRIANILREHSIDVVHVHAGVPALLIEMARKIAQRNIPMMATFHSWSPERPQWMNIADTVAFNNADYIVYDSEYYKQLGAKYGMKSNSQVIYPFVVDEYVLSNKNKQTKEILKLYGIKNNDIVISNLGEITERKGQLNLVKSFIEIRKQLNNVHLLLIGEFKDNEYYNQIQEIIIEHKLDSLVHFTGWVMNPYELVHVSDLFVFPSNSEGLGMAIVESILLGVPTIFSYKEGMIDIAQILGDSSFGTFNPDNLDDIVQSIISALLYSEQLRSIKLTESVEKIKSIFNIQIMFEQYNHVIQHVISSHKDIENN